MYVVRVDHAKSWENYEYKTIFFEFYNSLGEAVNSYASFICNLTNATATLKTMGDGYAQVFNVYICDEYNQVNLDLRTFKF